MPIYALGTTSGAHINPAVTISPAVVRRFPWICRGGRRTARFQGTGRDVEGERD